MAIKFSNANHEYIIFNPDDGVHEDRNGRDVFTVPGTGSVSGRPYLLILVDGDVDELHTTKY